MYLIGISLEVAHGAHSRRNTPFLALNTTTLQRVSEIMAAQTSHHSPHVSRTPRLPSQALTRCRSVHDNAGCFEHKVVSTVDAQDADEVLRRSRKLGHDEGRDFNNSQGEQAGFYALCGAKIRLTIYKSIKGLSTGDVLSLPFVFLSAGMFARYQRERDRFTLTLGIVTAIVATALIFSFLMMTW